MKRFTALLMSVGIGVILSHTSFAAPLNYEDYPIIKLRSLDKITARTMNFEAKVGSTIRFGDIFIKVQACRKPPPIEKNEAAAFLQIYQANEPAPDEKNEDTKSSWIFSGWMFASSPAISAMDHPIYDVWVLDCTGRDPEPLPPPEQQAADAELKEEASKATENKGENASGAAENTATDSNEAPKETPTDSAPTPAPQADETRPETEAVNEQSDRAKSNNAEPSVDEILQPEKATSATGTQNDDDFIYSPPKPAPADPYPESNNVPENPIPQDSEPAPSPQPENSPSNLDGIY